MIGSRFWRTTNSTLFLSTLFSYFLLLHVCIFRRQEQVHVWSRIDLKGFIKIIRNSPNSYVGCRQEEKEIGSTFAKIRFFSITRNEKRKRLLKGLLKLLLISRNQSHLDRASSRSPMMLQIHFRNTLCWCVGGWGRGKSSRGFAGVSHGYGRGHRQKSELH